MILDGGDGSETGDGAYIKPSVGAAANEGAVYVVAGSSGKVTAAPLNHPAMFLSTAQLGSVVLDIIGNRMDVRFLRSNGVIRDAFTILKGASSLLGDANLDCVVDLTDLAIVLGNFGQTGVTRADGDVDEDGDVDLTDLARVLGSFGQSCG